MEELRPEGRRDCERQLSSREDDLSYAREQHSEDDEQEQRTTATTHRDKVSGFRRDPLGERLEPRQDHPGNLVPSAVLDPLHLRACALELSLIHI